MKHNLGLIALFCGIVTALYFAKMKVSVKEPVIEPLWIRQSKLMSETASVHFMAGAQEVLIQQAKYPDLPWHEIVIKAREAFESRLGTNCMWID